jgi:hypothetical protein
MAAKPAHRRILSSRRIDQVNLCEHKRLHPCPDCEHGESAEITLLTVLLIAVGIAGFVLGRITS